jgi:hypothetical protein
MMMILMKVSDISNEARPMDVAMPWLDCLLMEFFNQVGEGKHSVVFYCVTICCFILVFILVFLFISLYFILFPFNIVSVDHCQISLLFCMC